MSIWDIISDFECNKNSYDLPEKMILIWKRAVDGKFFAFYLAYRSIMVN